MPCRSDGYPASEELLRSEYDKLKKELDTTTRLLCNVLNILNTKMEWGLIVDLETSAWFHQHQEADRKRREAEERVKKEMEYQKQMRISQLEAELARLKGGD